MDDQALTLAITKALAYTENGGKPDINNEQQGKSGEMKSIFQFLPATWKEYSKQVTGQDNLPLTPVNEAAVVGGKVNQWVEQFSKEGKSPEQIASAIGSLWNSGHTDPNIEGSGINKEGVKYDAPGYAKKVAKYTQQFLSSASDHLAQNTEPQNDTQVATNFSPAVSPIPQGQPQNPAKKAALPLSMQQLIQQQSGKTGLAQQNNATV